MESQRDMPVRMHPLIQGIFDTAFPVLKDPVCKEYLHAEKESKPEEKEKKGGKDE